MLSLKRGRPRIPSSREAAMTPSIAAPPVDVEKTVAQHTNIILIVPPPPYPLINKSPFRPTLDDPDIDVQYYIRTSLVQTKQGPAKHRHATALQPRTAEPYAASRMLAQLAEIGATFPRRSFQGHIEAHSEDGHRWRYVIGPGGVPDIVWPEVVYRWPGEIDVEDIKLSSLAQEALHEFAQRPGVQMSTSEVAELLNRAVSTLSSTLNHLQQLGLLRGAYEESPAPGASVRRHPYTITPKGLAWTPR